MTPITPPSPGSTISLRRHPLPPILQVGMAENLVFVNRLVQASMKDVVGLEHTPEGIRLMVHRAQEVGTPSACNRHRSPSPLDRKQALISLSRSMGSIARSLCGCGKDAVDAGIQRV